MDTSEILADEKTSREEPPFTFSQRCSLFFIHWLGAFVFRLIGMTLRYTVSSEDGDIPDPAALPTSGSIALFWHRCAMPATYFFRDRGIFIMTSRSFDGEFISLILKVLDSKPFVDPVRTAVSAHCSECTP